MKTNKSSAILSFAVAMLIAAVVGSLLKREDTASGYYFFTSSGGDIVMKHQEHATDLQCADCHHDLLSSDKRTDCSECHGDDVDAGDFEHAELVEVEDHRCTTCHQRLHKKDPANCRTCHLQEVKDETGLIACAECHDESVKAGDLTHDEMLEVEDHSCEGCHSAMSIADAFHQQCSGCHLKSDQAKFANAEGAARCEICHLK